MSLSRALRLKDLSAAHAAIMGRPATLDSRIAALAGVQPIITSDLTTGQAWLRGAPYALTSLPGWSFSRALAAYGETSAGVLVPFASGAPRLVNGRGQLIEGARTNLCLRSQEFDNASWGKANVTITADATTAPDGTQTADLCTVASTAATNFLQNVGAVTGTNCCASVYVQNVNRTGTVTSFILYDVTAAGNRVACSINWSAMTVSGTGASIQRLGSTNWYRIVMVDTAWTSGNTAAIYVGAAGASLTSGLAWYLWGGQAEAAAFPSSYIPTTTTSVTRPADIPLIDISAYSPAITYPLTMYARFERVVDTGGNEFILQVDNGTAAERAALRVNSSDQGSSITVATTQQSGEAVTGALALATAYRSALRVAANDVKLCRSGTLSTGDTSCTNPATPSIVRMGSDSAAGAELFGYLSEFAIIPGAVSDANLPRLAPA